MKNLPSYRQIWELSYPLILSLVAQNIINVTDTAFLGRVGEVELGASALAGLFYISLFMIGMGFCMGSQILMARRNGEQNYREIGVIFDHSLYFLMLLAVVLLLTIKLLIPPVLGRLISSEEVYHASIEFLRYRIWGIFFAFAAVLFRAFYTGITRTRILSVNAALMAIVNVILAWLLIFGKLGFPKMGIAGAGLASVIAEATACLFLVVYSMNRHNKSKYGIFSLPKLKWSIIRRTLDISVFIMVQYFLSLSGWFIFFMIIEKMGEHSLAISNIIRSAYLVLMLPIWAFSSAANTLVSNAIGAGYSNLVIPILRKISGLSFVIIIMVVILSAVFPRAILSVYTSDSALIADALPSLFVITGALLMFSVVQVFFSGVSGTGNTNMALAIEFITISIYLAYVYVVGVVMDQSIEIAWTSEYVYFMILGALSLLYLRFGKWRNKVI